MPNTLRLLETAVRSVSIENGLGQWYAFIAENEATLYGTVQNGKNNKTCPQERTRRRNETRTAILLLVVIVVDHNNIRCRIVQRMPVSDCHLLNASFAMNGGIWPVNARPTRTDCLSMVVDVASVDQTNTRQPTVHKMEMNETRNERKRRNLRRKTLMIWLILVQVVRGKRERTAMTTGMVMVVVVGR